MEPEGNGVGPRPDASAGLIEAANDIEKKANREHHFATSVAKNARARLIHRHRAEAFEEAVRVLRARTANGDAIDEAATCIVNRIWKEVEMSVDTAANIHGICQEEIATLCARAADRSAK